MPKARLAEDPKKCSPALVLGNNELNVRVSEDRMDVKVTIALPLDTKPNRLNQDLLQTARLCEEAKKFVTARLKYYVGQVRDRLQAKGVKIEPGLLTAILVENHKRVLDWKERSIRMHARALKAERKFSAKQARMEAVKAADVAWNKAPETTGDPKVKIRGA